MTHDVARIRRIAESSLKRARDVYEKTFGRPVDDPSINEALDALLAEATFDAEEVVQVPEELVLAMLLRPGGRGRGHSLSKWERRFNDLAVRRARKFRAEGMTAEEAAKAAKEAVSCRISAETILDRMNRATSGR